MDKESELKVSEAVAIGHLTISLPAVMIMLAVGGALYVLASKILSICGLGLNSILQIGLILICTIAAVAPAWMWWSRAVRRWRNWTVKRGIASEALEKLAVRTGLVWPNRWFESSKF